MLINRLEKRFGHLAIPNLTVFLIVGQVLAFIAQQLNPDVLERIALIPNRVLDGEFHRLFTFLFVPPGGILFFVLFAWYLFHLMGTALEQFWGTFRYNLFLLIGYLATIATSFLTPDGFITFGYVQASVLLAFAWLNPYFELRIMFILPIQIRWLALLTWVGYGFSAATGTWEVKLQIAAAVLNFFVLFGREVWQWMVDGRRVMQRKAKLIASARREPEYFHICEVCGVTDKTDPQMDFRYCSRCNGNLAYCSQHLQDHDHVQDDE